MSDDWHYSHQNDQGHRVNAAGYDQNGDYRGSRRRDDYSSGSSGGGGGGGGGGGAAGGSLFGLAVIIFIIYKIIEFIKTNWISFAFIGGIILACVIVCIIIGNKTYRPGLPRFLTILVSIGLISGVIYLGFMQDDGNFDRWKTIKEITTVEENLQYAYVNTEILNLRSGPSASYELIRGINKDTRVQVIDSSGYWWKIKIDNTEGFVNSEYLRK